MLNEWLILSKIGDLFLEDLVLDLDLDLDPS